MGEARCVDQSADVASDAAALHRDLQCPGQQSVGLEHGCWCEAFGCHGGVHLLDVFGLEPVESVVPDPRDDVDAGQLGEVIRNLILNAQEAMPKAGCVLVRAINVRLRAREQPALPAGEYVLISIADQGNGIAQDILPKIFDPYFSTKQRGTQKGMGLGLTICHSIIQKHQGAINVESALGVGTTFNIYLPANRKLHGAGKPLVPGGDPQSAGIMVTEDDEEASK